MDVETKDVAKRRVVRSIRPLNCAGSTFELNVSIKFDIEGFYEKFSTHFIFHLARIAIMVLHKEIATSPMYGKWKK